MRQMEETATRVEGHEACLITTFGDKSFIIFFPCDHQKTKKLYLFCPPGRIKTATGSIPMLDIITGLFGSIPPYSSVTLAKYCSPFSGDATKSLMMLQDSILCDTTTTGLLNASVAVEESSLQHMNEIEQTETTHRERPLTDGGDRPALRTRACSCRSDVAGPGPGSDR